jgi:tetratricopeptide (TPR) repeat protein
VNVLEDIIEAEGESADALNLMGYSLRNLDRNDEAMDFYNQALAMDPEHQGALEYQGELYLKMGNQAAAEANLSRLADLCPDGCDAHGILQTAIERFKDGGVTSWVAPER